MLPRSLRLPALLTILLLGLLGLAACGGSDDDSSASADDDPAQLLQATFGPGKPIRSGKLDVGLSADLKGIASLNGPISLRLTGPFQSAGTGKLPDFDLALAIQASGASFDVGAIATGGKAYLSLQGQAYELGGDLVASLQKGFAQSGADSKNGGTSLGALGIKPLAWLKDPRNVGTEDIGGTETVHMTAGLDVAKLLDDINTLLGKSQSLGTGAASVPTELPADVRAKIQESIKDAKVDIWTGADDQTLRRLRLAVTLAIPQDVRSSVGGLEGGTVALDVRINDLNKPQTVKPPANPKPLSDFSSALGALGLGGGSGSGSGSSSGSGGSGAPQASSDYAKCLQEAGTDVAKIQKCAVLLK